MEEEEKEMEKAREIKDEEPGEGNVRGNKITVMNIYRERERRRDWMRD